MSGKRKPSPELTAVLFDGDDKDVHPRKSGMSPRPLLPSGPHEVNKVVTIHRPHKHNSLLPGRESTGASDYESVDSPGASSNASSEGSLRARRCSSTALGAAEHLDSSSSGYLTDDTSVLPRTTESRQSNLNITSVKVASKKKKSLSLAEKDSNLSLAEKDSKEEVFLLKKDATGSGTPIAKHRAKKEPLPMRLRALPQSFWQQPNRPSSLSPGSIYPILPPLYKDELLDVSAITQVDGPEEGGACARRETVSVANTDLLFSLFKDVEDEQRQGQSRVAMVRRGRPKKPPSSLMRRVLRDDDPCLVSTASDSILPLIPDRSGSGPGTSKLAQGQQVLAMVSLRDGDKSVSLPSLSVEHHYSQILSELVVKL